MSRRFIVLLISILLVLPQRAAAQEPLTAPPDDPRLKAQWAVQKIGLECAWSRTTGSPDVTVAVIDSGIDLNHPDLKAAIRSDGFNAVDRNNDPTDLNGHGTHVAGIIAATINNGEGIAGVAGGGTKILPIRVMAADGSGTNEDIIAGIRYAVEKKVQIINMSLGSLLPLDSEDIVAAIKDANDAGVLVIVAAGNSFVPLPNFAFGIEQYALVVAATDEQDRKTDFSNYGKWIAVSAPGDEIMSTMPTYDVYLTSELPPEERYKKNYDTMSGTSQATPIIAGVAALLFAQHSDWTATQVRAEIQRTASDIAAQNPRKQFGPITYFEPSNLGTGRVNACDALGGPIKDETASGPDATSFQGRVNPLAWLGLGGAAVVALFGTMLVMRRRRSRMAPVAPQGPFPPANPGPLPQQPSLFTQTPLLRANPPPAATGIGTTPAWGKLTIEQGPDAGRFFLLREATTVIGRETGATIVLSNDNTISRRHVIIRRTERGTEIEDAGSSHGTRLNGTALSGIFALRPGDSIQLGQTVVRYDG